MTRDGNDGFSLFCGHCGGGDPLPRQMLDRAIQAVEGVNKLLGPEQTVNTPWGVKTESEMEEASQTLENVLKLNKSNVNREQLEAHVAAKHFISREQQRQQPLGLVVGFHQQAHRFKQYDHSESDLRVA